MSIIVAYAVLQIFIEYTKERRPKSYDATCPKTPRLVGSDPRSWIHDHSGRL
ncbi:hypothetical protein LSP04_04510 [Levilactobacillus spicheri]|uniref:Transposase n=1 Tax=Levilactobacillus spicheri TaxID=216463 RepID=A0ABQ0WM37_9LACO|nr:hypothetical protein LSP04_04510 [Levilactobacillus spicheri]